MTVIFFHSVATCRKLIPCFSIFVILKKHYSTSCIKKRFDRGKRIELDHFKDIHTKDKENLFTVLLMNGRLFKLERRQIC